MDERAEADEEEFVHAVYDRIAPHFSATRYKPWPLIKRFFDEMPYGSIGLDAGCGNGKYLQLNSIFNREKNQSLLNIGLDHSRNLLQLASQSGPTELLQGDCIRLPLRNGVFDFAISIATIHHFSTWQRRVDAISQLMQTVKPNGGQIIIQVWALEQGGETMLTKKKQLTRATLGNSDNEQDVFVPWTMQSVSSETAESGTVYQRYYHLFRQEELSDLVQSLPSANTIQVVDKGWERGNWWIWLKRKAE